MLHMASGATDATLAQLSNQALYSTMLVLLVAMLMFAVDLATTAGRTVAASAGADEAERTEAGEQGARARADQLMSMSASAGTQGATATTTATVPVTAGSGGSDSTSRTSGSAPRRKWAGMATSLTWLGFALLVLTITLRGLSVDRPPLGNMYEFALVGSAFVLAVYLGSSLRRDLRWLGLFVVGPTLLTLGLAITVFYTQASQLLPSLHSFWLIIHVTVATLATAVFTIAFSVTVLFLVKSWLEWKPEESLSRLQRSVKLGLPTAASLDRTAYGLHVVAFPLWTFTLIAGAIWAEVAWGHYWNWDPKEVWTFVIWVVYAAYLHARATSGWGSKRASYIALIGFGCILVNYMVVNVYFVGQHSYSGM